MSKLLYIESSPRKQRSASIAVAEHYLAAFRKAHPDVTVEKLDLWAVELPAFNEHTIDAKYAILHGQPFTSDQEKAWKRVTQLAEQFKSADRYLISLPMWNFGIPYILKHYIDLLVQPGLTFSYTPEEGYKGLVTGKTATVIYARGGAYGPGTGAEGYDLQSKYLEAVLGFIGITDVSRVFIEPTLAAPADKDATIERAKTEAAQLATR